MSAAYPWNPQDEAGEGSESKYREIDLPFKQQLQKHEQDNLSSKSFTTATARPPSAIPIVRKTLQQQLLQKVWGPSSSSEDSTANSCNDASSGAAVQRQPVPSPLQHEPHSSPSSDSDINKQASSGSGNTNPNQASRGDAEQQQPQGEGETLWERAEHFFTFSPAQAALLCNADQLSAVLDGAFGACAAPVQPRDLKRDLERAAADDQPILGISHLCGPEAVLSVPWCGQQSRQQQQQRQKQQRERDSIDDDYLRRQQSTASRRWQRHEKRLVTSRTHEEIEVSPNHHVQVRLPPTNPIMEPAMEALYSNISAVTQQQQQQQQPRRLDNMSSAPEKVVTNLETIHQNNDTNSQQLVVVGVAGAGVAPISSFTVKPEEAAELERSISELTMRSSYASTDGALQKIPENRRMAYYAVGKHHRQSGRGGNRRCYFTGKLILGGAPFYAGSVLQGLRTLVVFCLPSAIGMPDRETIALLNPPKTGRTESHSTSGSSLKGLRLLKASTNGSGSKTSALSHVSHYTNSSHNLGAAASHATPPLHLDTGSRSSGLLSRKSHKRMSSGGASTAGYSHASKSMMSRLSSLDDLSLSVEGDLDPNWNLDRDMLLKVLPPANPDLLQQMATLYPDQFETLPVQVREAQQWKLYVKFCFFSGLPISDGEMHYKVRDDIAEQVYGEEIVLSHDVMEAATGASAEILTLPNRTVIRYLRKHYAQQCTKLDDRIFQRSSWERVAPEV